MEQEEALLPRMAKASPDVVLEKLALSPAQGAEQEQELLQALLKKYEDHRGVGQDAKWAVILREFNSRASEGSQKTEASLKRAAKKLTEQARVVEDALDKFLKNPAQGSSEENDLLTALLTKYAEHRGTGDDAKWTVITREFNARACEASQKSEASVKRMAKKASEKAPERAPEKAPEKPSAAQTPEKVAKKKDDKTKADAKSDSSQASGGKALVSRDGYVLTNVSGESLAVRYFSRSTEEYEGPVATLAVDCKISLEFLTAGDLDPLLASKEIEETDTMMVRCFLFMMRMKLKTPEWCFDEKLLSVCCDKWAKEGEWTEDALATQGTVELHVWAPAAAAETSAPSAKWEVKVCRCEDAAESGKRRWGATFSEIAK